MLRSSCTLLMGLLMTSSFISGSPGAVAAPATSAPESDRISVIAHRGASADAPENTLPAIDLGAAVKADFVEVDVQMTRDEELVIVHDTTLRRTTDVQMRFPDRAPWNVRDFTLAEIRTLDAGSWYDTRYASTKVPTLQDVLDTLRGRAGLLLEVKAPELYPGMAAAVVAKLDSAGWLRSAPAAPRLVVQSFDWTFMRTFHHLAPGVPVGLLGGSPARSQLAQLSTWADQLNVHHLRVSSRFVEQVHRHGMTTWPYTVNNPKRMRTLLDLGVDGVITNHPDVVTDVERRRTRTGSTRG